VSDNERFLVKVEVPVVLIVKNFYPCNEGMTLVGSAAINLKTVLIVLIANVNSSLEFEIWDFYIKNLAHVLHYFIT
jgi:hypothetical protein